MVDVDLERLQQEDEEARPRNLRLTLERRGGEAQAKADEACGEHERQEGESAKPPAVGEAADIGIVRFEAEGQAPAQRTEAIRPLDQHRNAANLVAEAPGHALVVLLGDLGAISEPLRDL